MSNTCPECGEPAVHRPPEDLVPYQAHGTPPQWSHPDRSALWPVMTADGYRPAVPAEPETAGPDTPIPHTLTPQADAYLDAAAAELSLAEPEPEASAELPGEPDFWVGPQPGYDPDPAKRPAELGLPLNSAPPAPEPEAEL